MSPKKSTKLEPKIVEILPQKMAVVRALGAPEKVFPVLMPALYGSVYTLKFDLKKKGLPIFKVSGLRARYPGIDPDMKEQWNYIIGLPIPEDTTMLPQKVADINIMIDTWRYGTVAQILHLGSYGKETSSIERLLKFIEDSGYEITGDHEEEYLTKPDAKVVKTIIRYEVSKK
jgi:effector-binding domain-containing protein